MLLALGLCVDEGRVMIGGRVVKSRVGSWGLSEREKGRVRSIWEGKEEC
jgi:hypothetical protein